MDDISLQMQVAQIGQEVMVCFTAKVIEISIREGKAYYKVEAADGEIWKSEAKVYGSAIAPVDQGGTHASCN